MYVGGHLSPPFPSSAVIFWWLIGKTSRQLAPSPKQGINTGFKISSLPGGGHSRASSYSLVLFLCELTEVQGRET